MVCSCPATSLSTPLAINFKCRTTSLKQTQQTALFKFRPTFQFLWPTRPPPTVTYLNSNHLFCRQIQRQRCSTVSFGDFSLLKFTFLAQNQMPNAASNFFQSGYSVGYHPSAEYYSQLQQNLVQPQQRLNIPTMLATTSTSSDNKNSSTISLTQTHTIQLTQTVSLNDGSSANSTAGNNNFGEKKLVNHFKNTPVYPHQNKNQKSKISV